MKGHCVPVCKHSSVPSLSTTASVLAALVEGSYPALAALAAGRLAVGSHPELADCSPTEWRVGGEKGC